MYEDETGEMPPALGLARPYVGDSRVFATAYPVRPHPKQGPYPAAAFGSRPIRAPPPFPIDFGYLKTYPPNDENRTRWRAQARGAALRSHRFALGGPSLSRWVLRTTLWTVP